MNLSRRLQDAMCATATMAMLAFLLADRQVMMIPAALGAGLLAWVLTLGKRASRPWALPRHAVTLLVFAAIVFAGLSAMDSSRTEPVVSVLGMFLVHITCVKLFDRRTARDDAQLITLAMFVTIAAVLTGNTLDVGIVLAVLTPLSIAAIVMLQFRLGASESGQRVEESGLAEGNRERRAWRQLKWLVSAMSIACVVVATGIFVLTPRGLAQDVLGRFGQVRETRIGFTDTARLGQAGLLKDDPTPVLDVAISDLDGTNLGGVDSTLYLRGSAKGLYDRETWTWKESGADRLAIVRGQWRSRGEDGLLARNSIIRELKVSMRASPARDSVLFSLWRPVGLVVGPDESVRVNTSTRVFHFGGERSRQSRARASGEYRITCVVNDDGEALPVRPPTTFKDTPVESYTRRILAESGIDPDKLADDSSVRQCLGVIREHLRSTFRYTTEMIAPREGQDPIEMFLFESKRGHCEYFASAMVAMCQSVGISARMALGYVATEYNTITGQYLVRESNAHAWVEAHVGRGRWMTYDPSPPGDIERIHRPSNSALATMRRWWDALEFSWARAVVSFDRSAQVRLMGGSADDDAPSRGSRSRERSAAESLATYLKTLRAEGVRGVMKLGVLVCVLAACVGLLLRAWPKVLAWIRRGWSGRASPAARAANATFYLRARRSLRRAGLEGPDSRSAMTNADALETVDATLASAMRRIVELYYGARFGTRVLSPEQLQEGERLSRVVAERVRAVAAASRTRVRGPKVR